MITLEINAKTAEISRILKETLDPQKLRDAMMSANKNAVQKTQIVSDTTENVRSRFNLEYKIGSKGIKTRSNTETAQVLYSGERYPLHSFKHSPRTIMGGRNTQHLISSVEKGENRDEYPAFRTRRSIFERISSQRFPIRRKYGASLPEMVSKSDVCERISQQILKRYESEVLKHL